MQVLAGSNEQVTPLPFGLGTHGLQQCQAGGDIGQGRHGPQAAGGTAQQGGSQQRQYAVFGGGGPYAAVKRPPAGDGDKLHGYPLLRWLCVEIVEDVGASSTRPYTYMSQIAPALQQNWLQLHTAQGAFQRIGDEGEITFDAAAAGQ